VPHPAGSRIHLGYREHQIVEQTIYEAFARNSAMSEMHQRNEFLSSVSHQLLSKSGYGVDFYDSLKKVRVFLLQDKEFLE
jgi:hypothetical protein